MSHAPFRRTDPFSAQWAENPEPDKRALDPQTILDTEDENADAYLWNVRDCKEQWLQFDGELVDIEQ
jgi:hypothetical protein